MHNPLRIAVVGAGAFGRNHLRVLHNLQCETPQGSPALSSRPERDHVQTSASVHTIAHGQPQAAERSPAIQLAAAVDPDPGIRAAVSAQYTIPTFATVADLLAADLSVHAATVAVPTVSHAQVAAQLLEAGLDVLIEKPLTATLAEADALIALAEAKGRILAAGHLERFNPSVTAALARLTRPMFFEAHRLSIFTPRSLDVDVVLDLMIHDLDILLTMANSPVAEIRAVGLPVLSRKVDIANVRLEFRSGAIANLTASRVSTEQIRKLRLFQPAQYLSLDYARQELLTINIDPTLTKAQPTHPPSTSPSKPPAPTEPVSSKPAPTEPPSSSPALTETPSSQAERSVTPSPASTDPPSSRPERSEPPSPAPTDPPSSRPERSEVERSAFAPAHTPETATPHPSAGLNFQKLDLPRAEPLRLELEDFLLAVANRTPPKVTASAARSALALALDINAAIALHTQRTGLN